MNRKLNVFLVFLYVFGCACGSADQKNASESAMSLQQAPFKEITDSIVAAPNNVDLLLRRAALLSQNNQHELANADYKKIWALQPSESNAILYTSSLFLTGKNNEAIALLEQCQKQYPTNIELMRRLGEAYTQVGKGREALALYDDLLKQDSTNFDGLYLKGMLYVKLKDTGNAIALLEKSYRLQPLMQNGLALANLYAETTNDHTIELCDALQLRDTARDFIDPIFLKGVYFSNKKDYQKANVFFDECINRDWKFIEPYLEKGIIFYRIKNYDEAIKTFQLALTVSYTNPDAYFWIGRCCEDIGKKEEALDYYYKALTFDKNFTEAREGIKRLHG